MKAITNTKSLEEINKKYNDDTFGLLPLISKKGITILPRGMYRKPKSSFRGVTAVFNPKVEGYEFPLYGMCLINKNYVIVPRGLKLNSARESEIKLLVKNGYIRVDELPPMETVYFSMGSEEGQAALANKINFTFTQKMNKK